MTERRVGGKRSPPAGKSPGSFHGLFEGCVVPKESMQTNDADKRGLRGAAGEDEELLNRSEEKKKSRLFEAQDKQGCPFLGLRASRALQEASATSRLSSP